MKQILTATAALLAVTAQAQLSGPNRAGPGKSPGTFQTPGSTESNLQTTTPPTISPTTTDTANISVAPPTVNPRMGPLPRTSLGTPDTTVPPSISDSLRSRTTFPSSRDWETGAGAPGVSQSETRRLTPIPDRTLPDITPNLPTINGAETTIRGGGPALPNTTTNLNSSSISGGIPLQPAMPSDLNTVGVNTPPRVNEQPLDKALSAKIRAQLSQTPRPGMMRLAPETIRDLRITSEGGKVILEGNVAATAERQLVETQARQVPGVVAVENRMTVSNRGVGAPATGQIGQSRQNTSDLNEDERSVSPDR